MLLLDAYIKVCISFAYSYKPFQYISQGHFGMESVPDPLWQIMSAFYMVHVCTFYAKLLC